MPLGRLCREPDGKRLIDLLAQHAPTWLVQMPALLTTPELEALQRRTHGATRERMLRELAEAVEVLSAERPLVLVLEDLHWGDVSTLDWLAFVARRREPARLLIIGAYRPVEVIVGNHSLKSVKQELQLHGQCAELPLSFLTEEHVAKYLVKRFASSSPVSAGKAGPEPFVSVRPERSEAKSKDAQDELRRRGQGKGLASTTRHTLAQLIHQRTEGNPLFMINLVDYLVSQGVLARIEGQWRLQGEVTAIESWTPESLQQMIEKQIERLSAVERRVLEAASVAGAKFSAAAVAAGTEIAIEEIEARCSDLARREQFLRARGTAEWPDGTVATRYGFLHALYQDVVYGRLTPRQQQRLHQQIGERVEQAYGEQAREIAAELALHFEQGRDYRRAIQYLQQAGENAVRRSAHQEAIILLTKGLELLPLLPDTPERTKQELTLQISLGTPFIAMRGYGASEVGKVYTRARKLCEQVGTTPQRWQVLNGLRVFHISRGELQTASDLAEQIMYLAQSEQKPDLLMVGHIVLGESLYRIGEWAPARDHFERAITLYDPRRSRPSFAWVDGKVPALSYVAFALWMLGYPDQAIRKSQEALIRARELSHPFSLAFALHWAAVLHLNLREARTTQEQAEMLIALSTEQGFSLWRVWGIILQSWALAEQGQVEEGIMLTRQGLTAYRATGGEVWLPYFLSLLAEAHGKTGQTEKGLTVLVEALSAVDRTGERMYEAELYRLKGELLLVQEGSRLQAVGFREKTEEAEACFHRAIEVARRQQAKSLELRAVMSLSRLWQQQGKKEAARQMLAEIYNWFTEGFDTKDLQEAKALLEGLSQ